VRPRPDDRGRHVPCRRFSAAQGQLAQLVEGAVEAVVVADRGTGRGVLPHRVVAPAGRQLARGGGVPGDPQRGGGGEAGVVAGAQLPPAGRGVEHRVAAGAGPVLVHEVTDPAHHRTGGLAVAVVPVRVPLHVQRARQGTAVGGPAAAVVDEVVRLGGAAGGVGGGEVVRAADHPDVVRTAVLLRVVGIPVVRALRRLGVGPADAAV